MRTNAVGHCDSLPPLVTAAADVAVAAAGAGNVVLVLSDIGCELVLLVFCQLTPPPNWASPLWFSCAKLSSISCSAPSSVLPSANEINRQHNSGLINFPPIIEYEWHMTTTTSTNPLTVTPRTVVRR